MYASVKISSAPRISSIYRIKLFLRDASTPRISAISRANSISSILLGQLGLRNLFFVFFMIIVPQALWAAYGNYNSILIGDQAAGMGGAYTAMDEDASALAWYNPATLAFLKGQSFSAAVGIYKKFDTRYGDNEDLTKASLRVNQGFFRALPSSTGSVVRFKEFLPDYTFAFSIVVPEYDTFKGDISNTTENVSNLSLTDESLWVGIGMAKKVSVNESFGLTIYYTARSMTKSVNDRTVKTNPAQKKIYNEEKSLTQNAVVPVLGYYLKFSPEWKFGLSARLPGYNVAGKGSYFDSLIDTTAVDQPTNNYAELGSKARIPTKYTVGLAWQPLEVLIIAADFSYYGAEQGKDLDTDEAVTEYVEHRPIWNGSLGAEYKIRPWIKIRAGGFTNFSSHPEPDPSKVRGQADRVDQLGFSTNVAFISGNIQYTFGGYYTGGRGHSVQRINHEYQVITRASQVFTMLVGTSYSF